LFLSMATFCLPPSRSPLLSKLLIFIYFSFVVSFCLIFPLSCRLSFFLYRSLLLPCDIKFVLMVHHYYLRSTWWHMCRWADPLETLLSQSNNISSTTFDPAPQVRWALVIT
jgi:hypothetical protein